MKTLAVLLLIGMGGTTFVSCHEEVKIGGRVESTPQKVGATPSSVRYTGPITIVHHCCPLTVRYPDGDTRTLVFTGGTDNLETFKDFEGKLVNIGYIVPRYEHDDPPLCLYFYSIKEIRP
jgi:hypothetical protein